MMNSISIFGKSLPWNAATTLWCVIAVLAVLIVAEIVILAMMLRKKKEETGAVSEQPPAAEEKEPEASTEWYEEPNPEALASEEEKSEEVKEEVIEEPAAEEEDEDVEDVEPEIEDDEEEYLVSEEEGMSVVLEKSYMARLIQTGEKTKSYYSEIKNTLLSYKKVHDRLSRKRETFRFGRQCVAKLAIKGKTLCVYLPINAGDYAESKYKVEDVSSIASNAEAPTIYRIKNARRMKYAKELISQIMESLGGVQREIEAVDYVAELKFKTTGKLIEEDLIRRKLVKTSSVMFGKALELTEEEAAMLAENAAKEKEEAAAEAAAEAISENAEAAEAAEVNEVSEAAEVAEAVEVEETAEVAETETADGEVEEAIELQETEEVAAEEIDTDSQEATEQAEEVMTEQEAEKKGEEKAEETDKGNKWSAFAFAPVMLSAIAAKSLQSVALVLSIIAMVLAAGILVTAIVKRIKAGKKESEPVAEPVAEEKEPEASTEWYEEPNPEALASEEEKSEEVKEEVIEEPAAEEEDEDVEDVEPEIEDDEEEYLVSEEEGMSVVLEKSYMARLIQTGEKTKSYYSEIKNTLLSYKKVHDRLSRKRETFRFGRQCVAKLAIKGKTLCVYLPINAGDYAESKYKVEDVSSIASNAEAPTIYRIKNARRMKYAKELISQIMESFGGVQREIEAVDYATELKFKTTGKLIEEDLIRRKLVKTSSVMFGKALELTEEEAAMLAENAAREKEEAAAEAAAEAISENAEAAEVTEASEAAEVEEVAEAVEAEETAEVAETETADGEVEETIELQEAEEVAAELTDTDSQEATEQAEEVMTEQEAEIYDLDNEEIVESQDDSKAE